VLDGTQGKYVYVIDKDNDGKDIASVRLVTLGDWVTDNGVNLWVVESGLKAGDQVIVDGVAKLRPNAPVKVAGAPGAAPPAAPGSSTPIKDNNKDAKSAPKA
jgi:membrane fusion protein, multidrug efflux system